MALIFLGNSKCKICGKVLEQNEAIISFPAFVLNELDDIFEFSDTAIHKNCVDKHSFGAKAVKELDSFKEKNGPGKRKCIVCRNEVISPEEHFQIGHLTSDQSHPLYKYNYVNFHKSHLKEWADRKSFISLARAFLLQKWKGPHLMEVLKELN